MPSLIQHQKSTKHCPCPRCDPSDSHEALLEARLSPIDKYSCPECRRRFAQEPSLEAHQRESLHAYCHNCDILSPTRWLHALHMQSHAPVPPMTPSSATQFRCCDCERDFKNEGALAEHLQEGNYCTKCKKCERTFKNRGALGRHLSPCVADAKCKKQFNCPSAQLQHPGTGGCVSGMTKTKLNAAIAANDTGRIITLGGRTTRLRLRYSPQPRPKFLDSYPPSAILTPTSTLSTNTNFYFMLTFQPLTRSGYQTCPLCPPALQQHPSSRAHAQVSMPLSLPRSKKKAHLESGACNGGKETFRREMKVMGFGGLKLLS
ncbi:hypothetical protein V2W45_1473738 [Cenococcum geophilum]